MNETEKLINIVLWYGLLALTAAWMFFDVKDALH